MKKFNLRIFLIATVIIILLNLVSLSGLEARDTPNRSHTLLGIVGSFWTILRFPIFTFFWKFIYHPFNIILFSIAVFLNCAFYGVIVERIFYLIRKKSKFPPVPTGISLP
jgi:hypothetical protein